ncbi:MAG TPA: SRPBCC family protein [Streptosporangiaceae bacterium]|nr:SRPBCC family protein [Streptosporangiaceae bacterium]
MAPPIVLTIDIACPPGDVYAYATDPTRFAEWQHDVTSVQVAAGPPPGAGSRFTTTRRIGSAQRTMTQEITQASPPGAWAARGVDGPIRPNVTVTIEPAGDGTASRATFTFDFAGHGIGELLVPLVRRMAAKGAPASLQNLKQRLEDGDHGPAAR